MMRPFTMFRTLALRAAWIAILSLFVGLSRSEGATDPSDVRDHVYTPATTPADNPLKGFVPFAGKFDFPHSMEWFYFSLKSVQKDYNVFDWSSFEQSLSTIAQRGHQGVFRTYLDYPNVDYGVPDFLAHVPKRAYTDFGNGANATSYSPDYEHPDLRRALTNYIAALGARYDGDPRIGYITLGILGFWGEWHTYPYIGADNKPNWSPSAQVMKEVLDGFTNAFRKTKLLVREPKPDLDFRKWGIGYHDDSFAFTTLPPIEWHFWPRIQQSGLQNIWRTQAIGGEVRPEVQGCMWNLPNANCVPPGQAFDDCVRVTHASWMLNQAVFSSSLTGEARSRAIDGARSLGYELWVPSARFPDVIRNDTFSLELTVTNRGVAPFYYSWPVVISLRPVGSGLSTSWTNSAWNLSQLFPSQQAVVWRGEYTVTNLAPGRYQLLVSVPSPMRGGKPIRFGNATQDTVAPGYLTLGEVRVSSRPVIQEAKRVGNHFQLILGSLALGMPFAVQQTDRLDPPVWTDVVRFTWDGPGKEWKSPEWEILAGKTRYFRVMDAE